MLCMHACILLRCLCTTDHTCDRCDTAVTVLSIIFTLLITAIFVICIIMFALLYTRRITIKQRKVERQVSIKFKKRILNKDRQIDELEANLLGDQDEQSNAFIEFETEVTNASKTSAQDLSQRQTEIYAEEIKRISAQLQREKSGRENDNKQS